MEQKMICCYVSVNGCPNPKFKLHNICFCCFFLLTDKYTTLFVFLFLSVDYLIDCIFKSLEKGSCLGFIDLSMIIIIKDSIETSFLRKDTRNCV